MKKVTLNQITLCADGSIGLQWMKQVLDPDTGEVLHSEPHRSVVGSDGDFAVQIDTVCEHLAAMRYAVDAEQREAFKSIVGGIDAVARADQGIEAVRQAKIKAAARSGR